MTSSQPSRTYDFTERYGSSVRIWNDTHPIGMGFLVDSRHIMTCAHVVREALDDHDTGKAFAPPTEAVGFDFFCNKVKDVRDVHKARVVPAMWRPEQGHALPVDVAVLEIDGGVALPPNACPIRSCQGNGPDDKFSGLGIKDDLPEGTYILGGLAGHLSADRIEFVADNLQVAISRGCSGAAIWNMTRGGVAGMVVEKHTELQGRIIPIESLGALWPGIMPERAASTTAAARPVSLRWRKHLESMLYTFDRQPQTAGFEMALDDYWDAKRSPVVCGILGLDDDRPTLCRDRLRTIFQERLERIELGGKPPNQKKIDWPDPADHGVSRTLNTLKQQVKIQLKARDASPAEIRKAYNAGVAPWVFFSSLEETKFTSLHRDVLIEWIGFWREIGAEALNKPLAVLLIFQLAGTPHEAALLEQVFKGFGEAPFDHISGLARLHDFSRDDVMDWLTDDLAISSDDLKEDAMKNLDGNALRLATLQNWIFNLQI